MINSEQTRKTIKRYLVSTVVTFFAGFSMVLVPALGSEELTLLAIKEGALVGVLFSGVRLGVKMVLELFLLNYQGNKDK